VIASFFPACSSRDFGRVSGPRTLRIQRPSDSNDVTRTRSEGQLAGVLAAWKLQRGPEAEMYEIGSADMLKVSVFALEEPGRNSVISCIVAQDGTIRLPWIEDIKVAGLHEKQAEREIRHAYEGRYIKNPEVSVTVAECRSRPIVLSGAVQRPGVYYLKNSRSSAIEILSEAGGIRADAGDRLYVIRSRGEREAPARIAAPDQGSSFRNLLVSEPPDNDPVSSGLQKLTADLNLLLENGDLSQNIPIVAGDAVVVPTVREQYVYVIGYVQRQGALSFRDGDKLGAVQAVTMAGGFADSAKPDEAFILRESDSGQKILPVQLRKIARAEKPPVYMVAGDTLVVPSSTLGKIMEFVKPSVGVGMQYSPVP